MSRGHDYENEIAKDIYRYSSDLLYPIRAGYSGNGAFPLPDVAVFDHGTGTLHHLEIKHVASETASIEAESDLQQMYELQGPNSRVWLVVKFSRRAPVTIPLLKHARKEFETLAHEVVETMEKMELTMFNLEDSPSESSSERTSYATTFNPRVSTSDSGITRLYLDKPTTDDWPSAHAADADYEEILSSMGINYENE